MAPHEGHHLAIHAAQPLQVLVGGRDERLAPLALAFLSLVMKRRQVAEHGRRRGRRPAAFCSPAALKRPAFPAAQAVVFRLPQHRREPRIRLQHAQIVHALPTGEIEQHQRGDHLGVAPTLCLANPYLPLDRPAQPHRLEQVQVDRQPRQGRHPRGSFLSLILEPKHSLCDHGFTSWVIDIFLQTCSIRLKTQGQRGFSLFWMRDQGRRGSTIHRWPGGENARQCWIFRGVASW